MATRCSPLFQILGLCALELGHEMQESIFRAEGNSMYVQLCMDNLLIHYNPQSKLILLDASPVRLGAVISHESENGERSIAFASRTLKRLRKITLKLTGKHWPLTTTLQYRTN